MNRIKEVLAEKGIKQKWLAEKLDKSYNIVNGCQQLVDLALVGGSSTFNHFFFANSLYFSCGGTGSPTGTFTTRGEGVPPGPDAVTVAVNEPDAV